MRKKRKDYDNGGLPLETSYMCIVYFNDPYLNGFTISDSKKEKIEKPGEKNKHQNWHTKPNQRS
ncbi:hypothetical protein BsIDN1_40820 [Bacillus safensis]|uniref:Uncharacterized protein n=1 Tax=Bacillus safensis TaxID=561879 RepID=A0A5S9MEC3_BACIA|nr:hypothetical protein BsIDN1_40820 [Bacillus safensis]